MVAGVRVLPLGGVEGAEVPGAGAVCDAVEGWIGFVEVLSLDSSALLAATAFGGMPVVDDMLASSVNLSSGKSSFFVYTLLL